VRRQFDLNRSITAWLFLSVEMTVQKYQGARIMSYAAHRKAFAPPITKLEPRDTNPPTKTGFWRRLFKAVNKSRQSYMDRQIARFIESHGGHFTAELERELMRRMAASSLNWKTRL
jgi:hypothetical protein